MKLVKYLFCLACLAGMHVSVAFAIETPDFVLERGRWEQLVVPANSSNLTVRELFADDLPAEDYNSTWVIFWYSAELGEYVNPGIDGTIGTGVGFWIIQLSDSSIVLDLPPTVSNAATQSSEACVFDECLAIALSVKAGQASYSMLGSAMANPVLIDNVRIRTSSENDFCQLGCTPQEAANDHQYISEHLWHYDAVSNTYIDLNLIGQLHPWQAVWLQAQASLTGTAEILFPSSPPAQLSEQGEASRFLAQATFGPTTTAISALVNSNYSSWIDEQINLPTTSMLDSFNALQSANPESAPSRDWVFESFWNQAVEADDQLRQRMAFALSQIFVISLREGAIASYPRGVADYYTVLSAGAFGNFRNLLTQVTLHPMMGSYLSHLGNEKGNPQTGKVPDENFAREVMQLFSIGLHQLNADGSVVTDNNGNPIETYNNDDVQGLARVFTGFSWNGPDTSIGRFQGWISSPDREIQPMQAYPQFHSTLEKRFVGTVIPARSTASPQADLDIALDALFNHPNVGPFIGKQLIQRLVSSNPSNDYVARVTAAFNNNGEGIRGDMRAVVRTILLDPEARKLSQTTLPTTGRIREPILRLAHWMRSFNAQSENGRYVILGTDDPSTSIGMTVLRSPSVFNFYRPGYVPPNTPIADAGLVSPEMQITHETSIAGYLNSMLNNVELGTGSYNSITSDYAEAIALGPDPQALVDYLNILLLHGSMSNRLQNWLIEAIETIDVESASDPSMALLQRARLAVYLSMASPEYIVLK